MVVVGRLSVGTVVTAVVTGGTAVVVRGRVVVAGCVVVVGRVCLVVVMVDDAAVVDGVVVVDGVEIRVAVGAVVAEWTGVAGVDA